MVYGDFKDLPRRTTSDKVLCYKAFNIENCTFLELNAFLKSSVLKH